MSKIEAMRDPLKSFISHALATETEAARKGSSSLYAPLLRKALGAKLTGGKVRLMISGAAPLPLHVQEFLLAAVGCPVIQGYGMTENCANATLAHLADYRAGHVGGPMPTMEVKLLDVTEMEYTTQQDPPTGEVLTRGPCNFKGYHKNQEETDKVLTKDGWLHTGDIGRWNKDGTLSIIDRKKNIFKLAQGEYIAAEKIEMAISKSKYISQPWVYGNSFLPMLVAVITPDFSALIPTAQAEGWYVEDKVELVKKPEAIALIMKEIEREAKAAALKSFEVPKKCVLEGSINDLAQGFSIENDCLTPTFKLKRPQLLKKYKAQVDEMYIALGEDPSKQQ
jgi:long-chain acyl-CoA synthetase